MAMNMYLKTPWNNGEVVAKGYEGWSDVLAWSWGGSTPISFTGGGVGRPSFQSLSITKWVDQTSVNLGGTLVAPKPLTYELATVAAGDPPVETFRMRMFNTYVDSLSTGGSGGEDRLTENVSLIFSRFTAIVTTWDAKGTLTTRGWGYDQLA